MGQKNINRTMSEYVRRKRKGNDSDEKKIKEQTASMTIYTTRTHVHSHWLEADKRIRNKAHSVAISRSYLP